MKAILLAIALTLASSSVAEARIPFVRMGYMYVREAVRMKLHGNHVPQAKGRRVRVRRLGGGPILFPHARFSPQ